MFPLDPSGDGVMIEYPQAGSGLFFNQKGASFPDILLCSTRKPAATQQLVSAGRNDGRLLIQVPSLQQVNLNTQSSSKTMCVDASIQPPSKGAVDSTGISKRVVERTAIY
eukprot:Platyproteum_vivax@DN11952_c0_g1_i1.p1